MTGDAERAVLGSMLLSPQAADIAAAELRPEDFAGAETRTLFSVFKTILARGEALDMVTALSELSKDGTLDAIGGAPFVAQVSIDVPSSANVRAYIANVQESARRRIFAEGMAVAARTAEDGGDGYMDAARDVLESVQAIGGGDVAPVGVDVLKAIENIGRSDRAHKSGISSLDYLMGGGLQEGDMVIIGARPGMGKTAFALSVILNMVQVGEVAVFVSLEMSREQMMQRAVYSLSGRDKYEIANNYGAEDVADAAVKLANAKLYIEEPRNNTADAIKALCYRVKQREKKIGIVVIDYLQLMSGNSRRRDSRNDEVSEITRSVKMMARDLSCPVMLLSQLNREADKRPNHRPAMSDLRDSGSIEQDADVIGFLYRDAVYDAEAPKEDAELIIAKNRNGGLQTIQLKWDGPHMRYSEPAWEEIEEQAEWEDL